jgi:hypothetical protein
MSASDEVFEFKCPVCGGDATNAGDGLPVYSARYGVCGGVPSWMLVSCYSEECGVLFKRRRPQTSAVPNTIEEVLAKPHARSE